MAVTENDLKEWRALCEDDEVYARTTVVPALLDEVERLRERYRPIEETKFSDEEITAGFWGRTCSRLINKCDALRAENERLRCSPDKEIQLRTEFGDKLSDAEKLIAAMNAEGIASAKERDALRSKLAKAKTDLGRIFQLTAKLQPNSGWMYLGTINSIYKTAKAALAEIEGGEK